MILNGYKSDGLRRRMMWGWFAPTLAVIAALSDPSVSTTSGAAGVRVVTVGAAHRVFPDDSGLGGVPRAEIFCGRGESESFQVVVINGGSEPLRNVTLQWSQPADAPSSPMFTAYRVHYVTVNQVTVKSGAKPGRYPDALIPFIDPATGLPPRNGQYRAAGFDVAPGQCQPYWIDIHVPRGARPGAMEGSIVVRAEGYEAVVTVRLRVWNIEIPAQSSLATYFGGLYPITAQFGLREGSARAQQVADSYRQMFAEHRLRVPEPVYLSAEPGTGRARVTKAYLDGLRAYVEKYQPRFYRVPVSRTWPFTDPLGADIQQFTQFLKDVDQMVRTHDWIPPACLYLFDEPKTRKEYEQIRLLGRIFREERLRIKNMVTEEITVDPACGSIEEAVDVWVLQERVWNESKVQLRRQAGKEIWSYTALVPQNRPFPAWYLEEPPVNYMATFWATWSLRLDGFLYWSTVVTAEDHDPWRNPATWKKGGDVVNGEGCLIYPGVPAGIEGPVPTIRLKMIRDGLECYEYLSLLAARNGRQTADSIARELTPSFFEWRRDWREYEAARVRLATAIIKAEKP